MSSTLIKTRENIPKKSSFLGRDFDPHLASRSFLPVFGLHHAFVESRIGNLGLLDLQRGDLIFEGNFNPWGILLV